MTIGVRGVVAGTDAFIHVFTLRYYTYIYIITIYTIYIYIYIYLFTIYIYIFIYLQFSFTIFNTYFYLCIYNTFIQYIYFYNIYIYTIYIYNYYFPIIHVYIYIIYMHLNLCFCKQQGSLVHLGLRNANCWAAATSCFRVPGDVKMGLAWQRVERIKYINDQHNIIALAWDILIFCDHAIF